MPHNLSDDQILATRADFEGKIALNAVDAVTEPILVGDHTKAFIDLNPNTGSYSGTAWTVDLEHSLTLTKDADGKSLANFVAFETAAQLTNSARTKRFSVTGSGWIRLRLSTAISLGDPFCKAIIRLR